MQYYKDKVCWVTGASSGIGEALVYELVDQGAKVIISARRSEELERVKLQAGSKNVYILPLDLTDIQSFPAKVKESVEAFGSIDIMVHNGGISQRSRLMDTLETVDRRIMEVNYFGTVALTKALLPHLLKKGGRFVVITSLVGKFGTPLRSTYAASKHALHGFFESLRAELYSQKIRVTMVCPGFIKTNVSINALTEQGQPQNKMDEAQAKGMLPQVFAQKMLKAVAKDKEEIYIGGLREVAGIYVKRFFPTLFSKIVRNAKVT